MIVYCDKINYSTHVVPQVGRASEKEHAVFTGPINKGQNLQIQCAVSNGRGLVEVNTHVGKIDMDMNASFLLDILVAALKWAEMSDVFWGKKVVLVLDNAPAPKRTEDLLTERLLQSNPPLRAH
jgi:hypothetical protein